MCHGRRGVTGFLTYPEPSVIIDRNKMITKELNTIAGNLTILAAASNIIISDVAEAKGLKSFTYFEFLKIGVLSQVS